MALRGYQDANRQLTASNAELTQANAAVAAAHEALKVEVAERERVEAALIHAQKLQAIGLLAGGIAHHFNNLLSVVLGNLHLARRHMERGENIGHYLADAAAGAQRGAEVVKQLLTFSRQQVLETQVIDVAGWLEAATTLMASTLRGDINVEVAAASSLWPVRVDPAQLELALLNLAVNARDAMPAGGTLSIAARNRQVEDVRLGLMVTMSLSRLPTPGKVSRRKLCLGYSSLFSRPRNPALAGALASARSTASCISPAARSISPAPSEGARLSIYICRRRMRR
jgi:signal transduction histidine kinase